MSDLPEVLDDIEAFLDDQADAEYFTDGSAPIPNEAMHLLMRLKQARKQP